MSYCFEVTENRQPKYLTLSALCFKVLVCSFKKLAISTPIWPANPVNLCLRPPDHLDLPCRNTTQSSHTTLCNSSLSLSLRLPSSLSPSILFLSFSLTALS